MEKEIWKTYYISGEETKYEVSFYGNYKSSWGRRNGLLKKGVSRDGYYIVILYHNKKRCADTLHRMVAKCFCEKNGFNDVNHIDGNKLNNHYTNLEWCSRSQNTIHAYKIGLKKPIKSKDHYLSRKVAKLSNGQTIKIYDCIMDAEHDGFKSRSICRAAKTGIKHHGFNWEYLDKKTA